MKYYIQNVGGNDLEARFKRSNLSFKYTLLYSEVPSNTKVPTIIMHLSPSGYDNPRCFKNGEFKPELIKPETYFDVQVTDYDVISDKLTDEQKRDLLKLMHENKPYTSQYFADYRKHHTQILKAELAKHLHVAERLRLPLVRSKGEKYYNEFIQSIKEEYRRKINDVQNAFTPAEKY